MIAHQLRCTHAKDSAGVDLAIIEALGPVADAGGNGILRTDVVDTDRIQSLSLEGLVVTLDEDVPAGVSETGRRRIEWRFPDRTAAGEAYGYLVRCGIGHHFWTSTIPGGWIKARTLTPTATAGSSSGDVEIDFGPVLITGIDSTRTKIHVADVPRIEIDTWNDVGTKTVTIPVHPELHARRVGHVVAYADAHGLIASLTFATELDASVHLSALRVRIENLDTRDDWTVGEREISYTPRPRPEPADTGMPRLESFDKPWFQQVAAWEEQLGHVPPDQLCTIKAGDLSVLIAESHMLHATLVLSCNDEPVEQARVWLGQIAAQPASARCEMRVDDMRQLLVDAMQERERVKADRIVVDRVHHNDLLRLRNVLADFVSTVGDSTVGRMIAAALQAEHDEEMFRIEEVL